MKKILLMCAVGLFVSQAAVVSADTIGPGYVDGSVQGIIDLGFIEAEQPGSPAGELAALNVILTAYNIANDPDLEAPATFGTPDITSQNGIDFEDSQPLVITLDLGEYAYLKLKWDGKWQYYFIGEAEGEVTFESTVFNKNSKAQALSHYTFFSPRESVPDGGSTAALLGSVLFAFGVLRRRYGKS